MDGWTGGEMDGWMEPDEFKREFEVELVALNLER